MEREIITMDTWLAFGDTIEDPMSTMGVWVRRCFVNFRYFKNSATFQTV
jgi:hypothetical protein